MLCVDSLALAVSCYADACEDDQPGFVEMLFKVKIHCDQTNSGLWHIEKQSILTQLIIASGSKALQNSPGPMNTSKVFQK